MPDSGTTDKSSDATLSPGRAVLLGHVAVGIPILGIFFLAFLIGRVVLGPTGAWVFLFGAVVPACLWWWLAVPLWREWAKRRGADEARTQHLAQRTLLVCPKGSFMDK